MRMPFQALSRSPNCSPGSRSIRAAWPLNDNFLVIKRAAYGTTTIVEGDEIEIVNFVGGG